MTASFRCIDTGTPPTVSRCNFRYSVVADECADVSWLDDDRRLAAFHDGTWHMIGIQAAATFLIPLGGHFVMQTMSSPGLWGIESDSGEAYLDEVFTKECQNLADMLAAVGVTVTVTE